ncbi:MAG: hypothetical protein Q7S89_01485 [bacterium]|nr:hypothetical protein [bacterium]
MVVGEHFDAEQDLLGAIRSLRADGILPRVRCGFVGLEGFADDLGDDKTYFQPDDHPLDFVCLPTSSMPVPKLPLNTVRLPNPIEAPEVVINKFLGPVDRSAPQLIE